MDLRKWLGGFRYAYEGIKYALNTQRNMKFHFFVSFLVLFLALLLELPRTDILFLLLAITLVVVAELINTSIEKAVDLAMPDWHPTAKIAKDVSAAAVLVTAVFAAVTGMIVFFDPIQRWFLIWADKEQPITIGTIWVLLTLVMLTVVVIETRFSDRGKLTRPSLLAAISFAVSTLITFISRETIVFLLSFTLSFLVMLVLYDKKKRGLSPLLLGAVIGTAISAIAFYLMNR